MKLLLYVFVALMLEVCVASDRRRPVRDGLRSLGRIIENSVKVTTGTANIYERIISKLALRTKLRGNYETSNEFCEALQKAAPEKMIDGIEAAAEEGDCELAMACLLTKYPKMPLCGVYSELLDFKFYSSLMCLVSSATPTNRTPPEEFLNVLEKMVKDEELQLRAEEWHRQFTRNFNMALVVPTDHFKQILVESMKAHGLGFLKVLLEDYKNALPLADLKFLIEETEMGLFRAIFNLNENVQLNQDYCAEIFHFLSVHYQIPFDDIVAVVFDMDQKGLIFEHLELLAGPMLQYVRVKYPKNHEEYSAILSSWVKHNPMRG